MSSEQPGPRSYAELPKGGIRKLFREARGLRAGYATWSADEHIDTVLTTVQELEGRILARYSLVLEGKDVLDAGTGQQLIQLQYFAQRNRAVGIDLDVVVRGPSPRQLLRMLRCNGVGRTVKTIARKALGIDVRHTRALRARLGSLSKVQVLQMDITDLTFNDGSFDFVYCSSVFHHLPHPATALQEIARVLRPGGVASVGLQLYTSETGSRDPELIMAARLNDLGASWAHLRSPYRDRAPGLDRVNGLTLGEWRALFESMWPGCNVVLGQPERTRLEPLAKRLQSKGELLEFSIEELVTHDVWCDWQKPAPTHRGDLYIRDDV